MTDRKQDAHADPMYFVRKFGVALSSKWATGSSKAFDDVAKFACQLADRIAALEAGAAAAKSDESNAADIIEDAAGQLSNGYAVDFRDVAERVLAGSKARIAELERIADDLQALCDKQALMLGERDAQLEAVGTGGVGAMTPETHANWPQLRSALAMTVLGWASRPDRTLKTIEAVLDAVTEPGMPLALLRAAPDWRGLLSQAAPVDAAVQQDAERYRWLRGNAFDDSERWSRWRIERYSGTSGWNPLTKDGLDTSVDAARAAQKENHD